MYLCRKINLLNMTKLRYAALVGVFVMCASHADAQQCRDDFRRDPYLAGSNYVAYPTPQTEQTPAPEGYEAVYMSHYGRHGSRYHIGNTYSSGYKMMERARQLGVLTAKGEEVMQQVKMLKDEAEGRDGELTELGALQHQQIAERMFRNFPGIFGRKTRIDAKSTVVIRCILSMENELQTLKALNPELDIRHDASHHDMWFMNPAETVVDSVAQNAKNRNRAMLGEFGDRHVHPERLMQTLFTSETFWRDSINAKHLMCNLYELAMNVQSSEIRHRLNMTSLFTEDELYDLWVRGNANWYVTYGPSQYSDGLQPLTQSALLRRMISQADAALATGEYGAHLRFGHDTMVMPLVCLLEIDGTGRGDITDLDRLPFEGWCDYKIFPMASNVQMVLYRSKQSDDILIKVLHNENEAHLPVKTDTWPYYKWSDFKEYYLSKMDRCR